MQWRAQPVIPGVVLPLLQSKSWTSCLHPVLLEPCVCPWEIPSTAVSAALPPCITQGCCPRAPSQEAELRKSTCQWHIFAPVFGFSLEERRVFALEHVLCSSVENPGGCKGCASQLKVTAQH